MAMTNDQLASLLSNAGLNFFMRQEPPAIIAGFETQTYQNLQSQPSITVMIALHDEGRLMRMAAHYCFTTTEPANFRAVQIACSIANSEFCLGRFLFDPLDGEVSLAIEHVLGDTSLSKEQLTYMLSMFPAVIDKFDQLIRTAVDAGEIIDMNDPENREFSEFTTARRGRRRILGDRPATVIQ